MYASRSGSRPSASVRWPSRCRLARVRVPQLDKDPPQHDPGPLFLSSGPPRRSRQIQSIKPVPPPAGPPPAVPAETTRSRRVAAINPTLVGIGVAVVAFLVYWF